MLDASDPTLKERAAALRESRDRAQDALEYARRSTAEATTISPAAVETFARHARERLLNGDVAARKAYLGAVVDAAVIVSEGAIRIVGRRQPRKTQKGSQLCSGMVPRGGTKSTFATVRERVDSSNYYS